MTYIKKKPRVGIIGIGTVGKVVKYWFKKHNYSLFLYDKYKKIGSLKEVNKAKVIFICVPTPFRKERKKGYADSEFLML